MTTPRDETALAMRFSIDHKGLPYRDPKGVWVAYSHHESALTAQAAENAELRAALERMVSLYESEQDGENVHQWRPDWLRAALSKGRAIEGAKP